MFIGVWVGGAVRGGSGGDLQVYHIFEWDWLVGISGLKLENSIVPLRCLDQWK
jgi:hypothetical protein